MVQNFGCSGLWFRIGVIWGLTIREDQKHHVVLFGRLDSRLHLLGFSRWGQRGSSLRFRGCCSGFSLRVGRGARLGVEGLGVWGSGSGLGV